MALKVKAVERLIKFNKNDEGTYRYVMSPDLYTSLSQDKVIKEAALRSGVSRGVMQACWDAADRLHRIGYPDRTRYDLVYGVSVLKRKEAGAPVVDASASSLTRLACEFTSRGSRRRLGRSQASDKRFPSLRSAPHRLPSTPCSVRSSSLCPSVASYPCRQRCSGTSL